MFNWKKVEWKIKKNLFLLVKICRIWYTHEFDDDRSWCFSVSFEDLRYFVIPRDISLLKT